MIKNCLTKRLKMIKKTHIYKKPFLLIYIYISILLNIIFFSLQLKALECPFEKAEIKFQVQEDQLDELLNAFDESHDTAQKRTIYFIDDKSLSLSKQSIYLRLRFNKQSNDLPDPTIEVTVKKRSSEPFEVNEIKKSDIKKNQKYKCEIDSSSSQNFKYSFSLTGLKTLKSLEPQTVRNEFLNDSLRLNQSHYDLSNFDKFDNHEFDAFNSFKLNFNVNLYDNSNFNRYHNVNILKLLSQSQEKYLKYYVDPSFFNPDKAALEYDYNVRAKSNNKFNVQSNFNSNLNLNSDRHFTLHNQQGAQLLGPINSLTWKTKNGYSIELWYFENYLFLEVSTKTEVSLQDQARKELADILNLNQINLIKNAPTNKFSSKTDFAIEFFKTKLP